MNQLEEVVKFVIYKCRENNNPVTETLAAFVAQTILNQKTKRFFLEDRLNVNELNDLKQLVLQKLYSLDSADLKTIQLQISYDSAFIESEIKRQERIKQQSIETGKLTDEVVTLEIKNAKDFEGLTQLYKKIFNFLLYKNKELNIDQNKVQTGQEAISHQFNVEKEVAAALESVIPRAALGPFVSLNPSEKVTQLVELSNLVIGIRLFNKEIGKGGVSLTSFNDLLNYPGRDLLDHIKKQAVDVIEHCDNYTIFFLNCGQGKIQLSKQDFTKFKDELTFLRQYLSYILSLQEDIEISENTIESNETRYTKEKKDLTDLLSNKSSAPKEQVYPKFATLAQSYVQLLEEKRMALNRILLFKLLLEIRQSFQLTLPRSLINQARHMHQDIQGQIQIKYNEESGIERLLPNSTPDFMQTPLDYLGFCVWSIVKRNGLLIPGKPALGVYRYKDRNCVFSDEQAINEFLQNPQEFLSGVIDQCRRTPELIHLLRMDDAFKGVNLSLYMQLQEGVHGLSNKLMVDKAIETPLHFHEKNIDPNYCWNEWELRKKAIQMANIRKKQTKACQTILSNFKVESDAQTYQSKDATTNTTINKATNPLRPRNYITGLRDKNIN